MAKLALMEKNAHREKLVKKYAKKRELLKEKMTPEATPEERFEAMKKLAKLPRNSSATRVHKRCAITGRARGYMGQFGLCRQQVRKQAHEGKLPGLRKSSW